MNEALRRVSAPRPLDLGAQPDFELGELSVHPNVRQVSAGSRRKTIEPRVMQVLVALAQAQGAVVSRDQLIERCWGGRVVGDDAVNSCLAKVRALADFTPERSFEIETIPRVGYRLHQSEPAQPEEADSAITPEIARPATILEMRRGAHLYLWGLAAAAVIAGAVALATYLYWQQPGRWVVVESHMPFIATPMIERYPAISPDGTMIAYSAGTTIYERHIFLRFIKGGDPIQLTRDAGDASAPTWSPDGRTVAYVIARNGHPCRIMEVTVPAGEPRAVGHCRVAERSTLAFDGGGSALFFADAPALGAPAGLMKLDLDRGTISAVTHPPRATDADYGQSLSPDGKSLLYVRALTDTRSETHILSLSDGSDRLLAAFDDDENEVAWSRDGTTVFVARDRPGNDGSLWAYSPQGGAPRQILGAGGYIGRLSPGPGGLLAVEMQHISGQLVAEIPHSDAAPQPLDETGGLNTWCVDYAADGTMLATGKRSDTFGIWISDPKGTLHQLISLPNGLACAIRWSPDGTRFAYICPASDGFDVPVMTRDGAPVARLHFSAKDSGLLDWTADGKSILTSRQNQRGWRIWRTDLATPNKSVPISPFGWMSPRVHGNMLFAEKDDAAGIWRIDGTPRRMTDGPVPDASDVYTIAGDRLIYSDATDPDHPMFSAVNVNGGPKDRLAPLPQGQVDFTFGVNPKTGAIVYSRERIFAEIGLMRLERR